MTAMLNLGCRFTAGHVDAVIKVKQYSEHIENPPVVHSVYGSPPYINPFGSTRPKFREEYGVGIYNEVDFERACTILQREGIQINITLNAVYPRVRSDDCINNNIFIDNLQNDEFHEFLDVCLDNGVDNFIVSNPLMIDYLHKVGGSFGIIISTIMNVHSVPQMHWIKSRWPKVVRVCSALWINRDIEKLKAMNEILPLELLANEFCSLGGVECEGLLRQWCYLQQSIDFQGENPMETCIAERKKRPWSWLMAKFILPQWLQLYETEGLNFFKITGRTHSAEYVEQIGKTYVSKNFEGNLLALWGHPQATLDQTSWSKQQRIATGAVNISTSIADSLAKRIFKGKSCNSERCGDSCAFCEFIYNMNFREKS